MADFGVIETYLAGLSDIGVRKIFNTIFKYFLKEIRFGHVQDGEPSQNLGGGFFKGTTPSVANTEFTIAHSFGRKPYLLIPVLPLDIVGATIVRLQMSRAADASRVYLKSADTSSPFYVYLEG